MAAQTNDPISIEAKQKAYSIAQAEYDAAKAAQKAVEEQLRLATKLVIAAESKKYDAHRAAIAHLNPRLQCVDGRDLTKWRPYMRTSGWGKTWKDDTFELGPKKSLSVFGEELRKVIALYSMTKKLGLTTPEGSIDLMDIVMKWCIIFDQFEGHYPGIPLGIEAIAWEEAQV
jgi:hypothetical protein